MASKLDKVEDMIERIAGKLIPKKPFEKPLAAQSLMMIRAMGAPGGMPNVRRRLLKDDAFPDDIRDMLKQGKTKEEIKVHYWACKEFRELWKIMEMQEETLDQLIADTTLR